MKILQHRTARPNNPTAAVTVTVLGTNACDRSSSNVKLSASTMVLPPNLFQDKHTPGIKLGRIAQTNVYECHDSGEKIRYKR